METPGVEFWGGVMADDKADFKPASVDHECPIFFYGGRFSRPLISDFDWMPIGAEYEEFESNNRGIARMGEEYKILTNGENEGRCLFVT